MLILFILAALTYAASSLAYAVERGASSERARWWARLLLAFAGLLHFAWIGAQSAGGEHPFGSVARVISFGAVITVGLFFAVARGRSLAGLGAIIAPLGLIGLVIGVGLDVAGVVPRMPASAGLTRLHIGLATAGLAGFILAAGVAAVYLAMERRLRTRRFKPSPGGGGASLSGLDRLHHRVMMVVTPIFTLAIVTGVLWIVQAGGVGTLRARWFELAIGGVAWLASVAVLGLRAALGFRGRRAAVLTLVAFVCTLAILAYYGVRQ
ncbi:MAG: cytochrome c biogenesis protein CcsA [Myxococcales bacterium]|nr:cytochrome c biogenesis protein CcsA [Myxococcales bacterium]